MYGPPDCKKNRFRREQPAEWRVIFGHATMMRAVGSVCGTLTEKSGAKNVGRKSVTLAVYQKKRTGDLPGAKLPEKSSRAQVIPISCPTPAIISEPWQPAEIVNGRRN
jgi:hypothetical protein